MIGIKFVLIFGTNCFKLKFVLLTKISTTISKKRLWYK